MILSRYVIREIFYTFLALLLLLLLVFLSQQMVRYLNYVAVGKIATNLLLTLVGFEIPYLSALLLPLALYLGIVIALSKYRSNHEMTIMRLSQFGRRYLYGIVGVLAFLVGGVVLWLMLWVNPIISMKREALMKGENATFHLVHTLMPGKFEVSRDGRQVIYAESLSRDHAHAKNLFIAKMTPIVDGEAVLQKWTVIHADDGYQQTDEAHNSFFMVTDGYRYDGVPGHSDYEIIQFKKYALRTLTPKRTSVHMIDEALTTKTLWANYTTNRDYAAELQWRFSIAFSAVILAIFALSFSVSRFAKGRYMILLPAILAYIIYINLLFVARHWVQHGELSIALGMWWVHGLALLGALLFL